MESPAYYAIIPAEVRFDKSLSPNSKLLYGELAALCKREGYCWANNNYFAEAYGVSAKHISRWMQQLIIAGYIKSEVNKLAGNTRKIWINLSPKKRVPIPKKVDSYPQKGGDPIPKKVASYKESITINNTINKEEEFSELWKLYPHEGNSKKEAYKAFQKVSVPIETLLQAVRDQIAWRKQKKSLGEFTPDWKHLCRWLDKAGWEMEVSITSTKDIHFMIQELERLGMPEYAKVYDYESYEYILANQPKK